MRTIFNDIRPRNIGGAQNLIFDPALPPVQKWAYRAATVTLGYLGLRTYGAIREMTG